MLASQNIARDVLTAFNIKSDAVVTQIYKSAWDINNTYVLKKSGNPSEFDKSIMLSELLASRGLPVIEYIKTKDEHPYFSRDDICFCLMKKIIGEHLDPFSGDCKQNGFMLGEVVAKLHQALSGITIEKDVYEADFSNELETWILPVLNEKQLTTHFDDGVLSTCHEITKSCKSLPRQIIHRDMHPGNLLFNNSKFSGYLDFDISQRNVRIFDICYLGCSLLVDSYKDECRLKQWQGIFSGILKGYESIQPLKDAEIHALPDLFVFDEVLFTAFFSKQNQPDLVQSCIDMTNWQYKNIDSILKICREI